MSAPVPIPFAAGTTAGSIPRPALPEVLPPTAGDFVPRWTTGVVLAGACLLPPATSSAGIAHPSPERTAIASSPSVRALVRRAIDASGLTVRQLARTLGVTRDTLRGWLEGRAIPTVDAGRLQQMVKVLDSIGRAPPQTRAVLLSPHPVGGRPIDWLTRGDFDFAVRTLAESTSTPAPVEGRGDSMPPPAVLLAARWEPPTLLRRRSPEPGERE